jgi:hypothetical protein
MDEIMNKVGSYWLGQKANKEMSSAGDDLEVRPCMGQNPFFLCSVLVLFFFSRHVSVNIRLGMGLFCDTSIQCPLIHLLHVSYMILNVKFW